MTKSLATDEVTRIVEHLFLNSTCLPPGFLGRYKGYLFISELLTHCSNCELEAIDIKLASLRQSGKGVTYILKQPIEERITIYIRRLKSHASRMRSILKDKAKYFSFLGATFIENARQHGSRLSYSQLLNKFFLLIQLEKKDLSNPDNKCREESTMKRLHLGCGTRYLNDYINIDYPSTQHIVQEHLIADRYEDICTLDFLAGSIDEVRLHHVFEHFSRQMALALLCRWTDWLKHGAVLHIETPDLTLCARKLIWPWVSKNKKSQIVRHLFGSHEAAWAVHWDGWYKERFLKTLSLLGYENIRFKQTRYEKVLHNIEVFATRSAKIFVFEEYEEIVRNLLRDSLVTHATKQSKHTIAESEKTMLDVWMSEWRMAYLGASDKENFQ